jgi:alkanesulfonate monooxygenase SsuD/methylene tetrahydromethanopterin reductase-like flavin-dependent oxidoreductase (luciferase family)
LARIAYNRRRQVVGTPAQVRERLVALAASYAVDELIVVSICFDFAARMRSYELLAEAFELPGQA